MQATLQHTPEPRISPAVLWTVQGLLALAFLFAGGGKLFASDDTLRDAAPFAPLFLRFIAVCEICGAAGLILPGLLHVRPWLTPLAAGGLAIIMAGATLTELSTGNPALAPMPFVLGLLATLVVWARWPVVRAEGSPLHGHWHLAR